VYVFLTKRIVLSSSTRIHWKKSEKRRRKCANRKRPMTSKTGPIRVSHARRRSLFSGCRSKCPSISLSIRSYLETTKGETEVEQKMGNVFKKDKIFHGCLYISSQIKVITESNKLISACKTSASTQHCNLKLSIHLKTFRLPTQQKQL
jgi:hypothetical protein